MSQRTTKLAVQTLLDLNYDGKMNLQQFIDSATVFIDRVVTQASAKGYTLSSGEQELIERYLAAHFYCRVDKTYQSKSTGGASASFTGQTGMSLDATEYGQMAVNLDVSGALSAFGKRQTAGGFWAGRCD